MIHFKKISILILLFSISIFSNESKTFDVLNKSTISKKKKVYLFAGQSNMDGRANGEILSEKDLARLEKVANRIQFYFNHHPVTNLQLTKATKFIKEKFTFSQIFGPELFFGIELAEKYPNDEFIFIKRSVGGTSLYGSWNPNWTVEKAAECKEENKPKLYFEFIDYVKKTLSNLEPNSYEIKGMLWVQGEADSNIKNYGKNPSETYAENLKNLIAGVRKEMDIMKMPFALFQVGKGKVIDAMIEVAKNDNNVFLITQSNDKNSPDFYEQYPLPLGHYTTESMRRIGVEFFKIFDKIY